MAAFLPFILLALVAVAYVLYRRHQEQELERNIAQAGDNKELILAEMDQAIQQAHQEKEIWKRVSGKWWW